MTTGSGPHATGRTGRARLTWSSWAIDNPRVVLLLFALLSLAGIMAAVLLPVQRYPAIDFPAISVTVPYPGTPARDIETTVTRPVEQALQTIPGSEVIISTVAQGVSTTVVQFPVGTSLEDATSRVRTRVEQTRARLPTGIEPPVVRQASADEAPLMAYAVVSEERSTLDLSELVDKQILPAIQRVPGAGGATRIGGVDRAISVVVDPARLAPLGLSLAQLNDALRGLRRDDPAGMLNLGAREQPLRVVNAALTAQDVAATPIPLPGGGQVRLDAIATVGDGSSEPRQFARLNGQPAVAFQAARAAGASEVTLEKGVATAVAELSRRYPDLRFMRIYSTVAETRASLDATISALLEGLLLTTLAVWLFLRDWRSTFTAAMAMPASLLPTFTALYLLGFTLNIVTLLALTLVIGILVDDAIVEIENIEKHLAAGEPPPLAARNGANAIGLAVVATTLAIVVVFLPVSFMAGVPGRFFHEFGITVSIAVLFSLLVARLLTPLMAAHLLRPKRDGHAAAPSFLDRLYLRALTFVAARPRITALGGVALMILAAIAVPLLPQGFQPPGNPDQIFVKVQGAPGAGLEEMEHAVGEAATLLRAEPEVANVFAQAGTKIQGGAGGDRGLADIRDATLTVVFKPEAGVRAQAFRERMRPKLLGFPDARLNFLGDTAGVDVVTILTGDDQQVLDRTAATLIAQMKSLPMISDPRLTNPVGAPEVAIVPRADAMARLGVTPDALAGLLRVATMGDAERNLARVTQDGGDIPIIVRLPMGARSDLQMLQGLHIQVPGGFTTLGAVADVRYAAAPEKLNRMDLKRQVMIEADLARGARLGEAVAAIRRLPVMRELPEGVGTGSIGNQRAMEQLFRSLGIVFAAAVVLMYALLVLLFGDTRRPLVILSALPPAVTGALAALLIGGFALDLPALIGILMLLGLAAKNSILIVDNAAEGERAGLPRLPAIMRACRERMRPIVMTSFAMIAGMVPTALALGQGAEFRQPLAIAVIGGMITSTLVSLVLVPALYLLFVRGNTRSSPPGMANTKR